MSRIGVFICHCGENISRTVDVERVAAEVGKLPGVACATDYKYTCSDPGQALMKRASEKSGSPTWSWQPARRRCTRRPSAAAESAGLNPYLCEMANIREHCSWVHETGKRPR